MSTNWKTKDPWSWREMTALLLLEFAFVIWVVKYGVQSLYEAWFNVPLYSGTLTGLTIAVVLLTGVYVIALRPHGLTWHSIGLRRFPHNYWKRIAMWLVVLIVLSVVAIEITSLFGNSVDNSKTEALKERVNLLTLMIGIVSAGIISPIYEEIFYRGFIYRWLRTRTGAGWSILISSVIFTAAHYPTVNAMPVNFISGVVFAWTYERTGSIIPAIIIHAVFNTIAVLLTAFS